MAQFLTARITTANGTTRSDRGAEIAQFNFSRFLRMVSRRRGRVPTPWTSAASRRLLKLAGQAPDVPNAVAIVIGKYLEGVDCPPTDLEALGPSLNILRFVAEPMPISGELRREAGGFVVAYSSFLGTARRRFTIAHELAHAIFESTGPNCPRTGRELERLCDMLATELLMPRLSFMREAGPQSHLSWRKIDLIARLFQTSLSATALRCAELLGVTAFEVEGNAITWSCGSIRKGPIAKLDEDIKSAVERTKRREQVGEYIFATTDVGGYSRWRIEGKTTGDDGRALVLMIPQRRQIEEGALIRREL